jgi:hypothetical protein
VLFWFAHVIQESVYVKQLGGTRNGKSKADNDARTEFVDAIGTPTSCRLGAMVVTSIAIDRKRVFKVELSLFGFAARTRNGKDFSIGEIAVSAYDDAAVQASRFAKARR